MNIAVTMCECCGEKPAKATVTNMRTKQQIRLCYQCDIGFSVAKYTFKEKLARVESEKAKRGQS